MIMLIGMAALTWRVPNQLSHPELIQTVMDINDSIDSCPTNPETWNKYDDTDGCPDVAPEQKRFVHDDDLDDIINDEDSCPLEPEDYDGDRDLDGCPDP